MFSLPKSQSHIQNHLSLTPPSFLNWRVIINKTWKCKRKLTASAVKVNSTGSLFQQPAKLKHLKFFGTIFVENLKKRRSCWLLDDHGRQRKKDQLEESSYFKPWVCYSKPCRYRKYYFWSFDYVDISINLYISTKPNKPIHFICYYFSGCLRGNGIRGWVDVPSHISIGFPLHCSAP